MSSDTTIVFFCDGCQKRLNYLIENREANFAIWWPWFTVTIAGLQPLNPGQVTKYHFCSKACALDRLANADSAWAR